MQLKYQVARRVKVSLLPVCKRQRCLELSELPNGNSNCNVFECSVIFLLFERFLVRLMVAKFYYRLLKKPLAFTNCYSIRCSKSTRNQQFLIEVYKQCAKTSHFEGLKEYLVGNQSDDSNCLARWYFICAAAFDTGYQVKDD